jgi:hypothetical protein
MERVLRALEPIRDRVGRLALVGHGWDEMPEWAAPMQIEDFYYTDRAYLERMGVEIARPVPFDQVIPWMSRAFVNPVIYRPLFERLGFVTCRTFETPAASTIPIFALDRDYVRGIYGPAAEALVLADDRPEDQLLDIVSQPDHYGGLVEEIRRRLAEEHSYARRIDQLVEIVES